MKFCIKKQIPYLPEYKPHLSPKFMGCKIVVRLMGWIHVDLRPRRRIASTPLWRIHGSRASWGWGRGWRATVEGGEKKPNLIAPLQWSPDLRDVTLHEIILIIVSIFRSTGSPASRMCSGTVFKRELVFRKRNGLTSFWRHLRVGYNQRRGRKSTWIQPYVRRHFFVE